MLKKTKRRYRKSPKSKRCTACGEMFEIGLAPTESFVASGSWQVVWKCTHCHEWNGKTLSALKHYAWRLFSETVKNHECCHGRCKCVTCGKLMDRDDPNLQAGHFIRGRHKAVLFDRDQVHCQCRRCNVFLGGNEAEYMLYMVSVYGGDKVVQMRETATRNAGSWTDDELRDIIHECEEMLA